MSITITHGSLRRFWCDRCLTSAGLEWNVYWLTADGPRSLGAVHRCARCDPS